MNGSKSARVSFVKGPGQGSQASAAIDRVSGPMHAFLASVWGLGPLLGGRTVRFVIGVAYIAVTWT